MKNLIVLLIVFFTSTAFAAQKFSSIHEVSALLNQIFAENMHGYADQIRAERASLYSNASDEEIFVSRNCGPTSRLFLKDLKHIFIDIKKVETVGHVYLEARTYIADRVAHIVIDPTYRQFFFVAAGQKIREASDNRPIEGNQIEEEILRHYSTRVLVVESKNLKTYLEQSQPYLPEWLVSLGYSGPPSTYKQYYKRYN